jgi:hypothetical protein
MRKHWGKIIGLYFLMSAGSVSGGLDPLCLFDDTRTDLAFASFRYCDTARNKDINCLALESDQLPDTGDTYNGSKYINFDYHFSQNQIVFKNEFDPTVIDYQDKPRPGYAGFKTAWDGGMTGFAVPRYKYLIFAHKGPNLNHKVTVKVWYNNGSCGAPSYSETLGEFKASDKWKLDTIIIPEAVQNKPDSSRNTYVYFEFVFIINNLNPADTTSGLPGNLKIDNMSLAGYNPIDSSPIPQKVQPGQPATFKVSAKPAVKNDVLTYQWLKAGVAILGATSATYTIPAATVQDVASYTATVTVASSGLTYKSFPAVLSVGDVAVINPRKLNEAFSIRSGSNGTVFINASMQQKTPVTISLYSIDGKTLVESTSRILQEGKSTCVIGNDLRRNGMFIVKITGADFSISKKVLVTK